MKIKELIITITLFTIGIVIEYLNIFIFENSYTILSFISTLTIIYSSKRIIEIIIEGKRFFKFKKIDFHRLDFQSKVINDIGMGLIFSYTEHEFLISQKKITTIETLFFINKKGNRLSIKINDIFSKELNFTKNTILTLQLKPSTFFSGPKIILSIIVGDKLYDIFRLSKPLNHELIEIQNFIEEKISWILNTTPIKYKTIIENHG